MARILLITLVLLALTNKAETQTIDSVYHDLDFIRSIKKIDSSTFIMVTGDSKVHALNLKGEIIWTKEIAPDIGELKQIQSYFEAFPEQQDSFFYVTTIDDHCDYFVDFRLFKIDFLGNVIDETLFPEGNFISGRFIYPEGPGAPEFIVPNDEAVVVQYSQDSSLTIPLGSYVEEIEVSLHGDFAILSYDSIYFFTKAPEGFVLSKKIKVDNKFNQYHGIYFNSDNLVWAEQKSIRLFNSNLETLFQYIPSTGEKIIFSKASGPHMILITQNLDLEMKFILLDQQFNPTLTQPLFFKNPYLSDLTWSSDSVLTITGIEFYPDDKLYPFIKEFNFAKNRNTERQDVGISNLKFDQTRYIGTYHCYGNMTKIYALDNVTIEIENKGNSTINNLTITPAKSYCYFWCDPEALYHKELVQMNLRPGEIKEYYIGHASIHLDAYESQDELCLTAVLPDYHVDVDHVDNIYCFDLTVGISNEADIKSFSFYPNPTEDKLYISSKDDLIELVIYNSEGKIVFRQDEFENGEVDVSSLAPGLFFIQYLTKHGSFYTDRFVKL